MRLFEKKSHKKIKKAISLGYKAKKIILTNPKVEPTDNYYDMLKQIEDFPDDPLCFECEFYGDYSIASFFEVDLVIKIPKYLLIIECKSYGIPFSEGENYIQWMDNFHYNMHQNIVKGKHILFNIEDGNIQHEFFDDTIKFVPIIVQTEGLFPNYGIIQFMYFERFLKELGEYIKNDAVEEFLKNPLKLKTSNSKP